MIENPGPLTVAPDWPRPTDAQVAALTGVPTGFVADALGGGGALSHRVARLCGALAAGPAVTADNGPADVLATMAALTLVRPGDVLVAATGGHTGCAAAGDRVMGMLRNGGGAGLVTDGLMRDADGIEEAGLPVWCAGLSPASPFMSGPGRVGTPVQVGGQRVCSGDMIVADRDGVVVVPLERVDEVIGRLGRIAELEAALDAEVAGGRRAPQSVIDMLDGA